MNRSYFRLPKIPPHGHTGADNIKIPAQSIVSSTAALGKLLITKQTTYTLYFASQYPTRIDVNGYVENGGVTIYGLIIGTCLLRSAYYFQPVNAATGKSTPIGNNEVRAGGLLYPVRGIVNAAYPDSPLFAQNCSSLTIDQSSLANTFPSSDAYRAVHANSIGGDLISGYFQNLTNNSIDLIIEVLASGYTASLNITIT